MEISHYAKQILLGSTLQDKLISPEAFEDSRPEYLAQTPLLPARSIELSLSEVARGKAKQRFPKNLEPDSARAAALHFFANHELLALELMAVALLRFKNLPAKFRLGMAETMREEQTHLKLYLMRINELGLCFGDLTLNRFFWDALAPCQDINQFVAGMSLTLEQANLDYTSYYLQLMRRIGDEKTATILEQVLKDEIGHVKHGMTWLRRWKKPRQSDWHAYMTHLLWPLTPSRAKGNLFNRDARLAAGLDDAFIDQLRYSNQSKGRPGRLLWFNLMGAINADSKAVDALQLELATNLMIIAAPGDAIALPSQPSTKFLQQYDVSGQFIPQILTGKTIAECLQQAPPLMMFSELDLWQPAPELQQILTTHPKRFKEHSFSEISLGQTISYVGSKAWAQRLRKPVADSPMKLAATAEDIETCLSHIASIHQKGFSCMVKGDHGKAATANFVVGIDAKAPRARLAKLIAQHRKLVCEPLLDGVADFSYQDYAGAAGQNKPTRGYVRFLTSRGGQFIGTVLGDHFWGLEPEIKTLFLQPSGFLQQLKDTSQRIKCQLISESYQGPYGIDGLIYRDGSAYTIESLIEVNVRKTMGQLSLALEKKLSPGTVGLWLFINKALMQNLHFSSFAQLAETWTTALRLEKAGNLIKRGVVFTSDPWQAKVITCVKLCAPSWDELFSSLPHLDERLIDLTIKKEGRDEKR